MYLTITCLIIIKNYGARLFCVDFVFEWFMGSYLIQV